MKPHNAHIKRYFYYVNLGLKERISIDTDTGMYFDAVVVFITNSSLLFNLTVAIK